MHADPSLGPAPHLSNVSLELLPPTPWRAEPREDAARSCLLRALLKHRQELLRWYPWVPLADESPATPVAALLLMWDRWDDLRGRCPRCGSWALGDGFTTVMALARVWGCCTGCGQAVSRFVHGVVIAVERCLADTPFRVGRQQGSCRWTLGEPSVGLLAVLEELGAGVGRSADPARRLPTTGARTMSPELVYKVSHNGGLVFAERSRAECVARIRWALENSNTWGEFRNAIPDDEYSSLMADLFDENGEDRPHETEPFSTDAIPAYSDGDYPPWLQAEMEYIVPDEILREFGTLVTTRLNGDYWHLEPLRLPEINRRLEEIGYRVTDGSSLGQWY